MNIASERHLKAPILHHMNCLTCLHIMDACKKRNMLLLNLYVTIITYVAVKCETKKGIQHTYINTNIVPTVLCFFSCLLKNLRKFLI